MNLHRKSDTDIHSYVY